MGITQTMKRSARANDLDLYIGHTYKRGTFQRVRAAFRIIKRRRLIMVDGPFDIERIEAINHLCNQTQDAYYHEFGTARQSKY